MQWLASYIMRGRWQAVAVASTLALLSFKIPFLSLVSSAGIALVTLRRGAAEGFIILACSVIVTAILGHFLLGNYQLTLVYSLLLLLPVWLISIVLRLGWQLSLIIELVVLFGMIAILTVYGYQPDIAIMWQGLLSAMLPEQAPIEAQQMLNNLSPYMTGVVTVGMITGVLFGLFIGRGWQAMLYNPNGFRLEFLSLHISQSVALISASIVVLALAVTGLTAEIAWNISILILLLCSLVGTAVLHSYFSTVNNARYVIYMFYATLFLIPHVFLLVALVGLTDPWLNLRKRIPHNDN